MNEEVKEILELQNKINQIENDTYTMKYIEWKAILDYITNLEQKIDKIIKLTEPFVEWEECTINGKILKRIYDIAKGDKK